MFKVLFVLFVILSLCGLFLYVFIRAFKDLIKYNDIEKSYHHQNAVLKGDAYKNYYNYL